MPRQLRIEYPGAIYHVINRGDRREPIFRDDYDRRRFIETLGEACAKTDWQVHAFCLMPNHFHLVIETPGANLAAGMHWLLTTFTVRFNRRHRLCGHLFNGRYKALIVDGSGNQYLRSVCDYVHLNPVRANLIQPDQALRSFPWSSWPEYLMVPARRVPWLRVDRLLGEYRIPEDSSAGRQYLETCLEQRRVQEGECDFKSIRRGWCLGDDRFRQELLEQVHRCSREHHFATVRQETADQSGRRIIAEELNKLGWAETELLTTAKGDRRKVKIAHRIRKETTMSLKSIAEHLQMGTAGNVANCLHRAKSELQLEASHRNS
jgi:putative transposase